MKLHWFTKWPKKGFVYLKRPQWPMEEEVALYTRVPTWLTCEKLAILVHINSTKQYTGRHFVLIDARVPVPSGVLIVPGDVGRVRLILQIPQMNCSQRIILYGSIQESTESTNAKETWITGSIAHSNFLPCYSTYWSWVPNNLRNLLSPVVPWKEVYFHICLSFSFPFRVLQNNKLLEPTIFLSCSISI